MKSEKRNCFAQMSANVLKIFLTMARQRVFDDSDWASRAAPSSLWPTIRRTLQWPHQGARNFTNAFFPEFLTCVGHEASDGSNCRSLQRVISCLSEKMECIFTAIAGGFSPGPVTCSVNVDGSSSRAPSTPTARRSEENIATRKKTRAAELL